MTTDSHVQIDKLETHNWGIWRRRFKALLLSKRLSGVIDGTDKNKNNSEQVLGLIQLFLSDSYLALADEVDTAKGLWDKLEATFTAQNTARRLSLRQELNNLKMGRREPIAEYVTRARELATSLEAVGHKPEDSEVTLSVLAGLPQEYSVLVTIVGTLRQTQTLDETLPSLLQMEQQISAEQGPLEALDYVPIYGAGVKTCYYCKKPGHIKAECPKLMARRYRGIPVF